MAGFRMRAGAYPSGLEASSAHGVREPVLVTVEIDGPHVTLQERVSDDPVDANAAEIHIPGGADDAEGTILAKRSQGERMWGLEEALLDLRGRDSPFLELFPVKEAWRVPPSLYQAFERRVGTPRLGAGQFVGLSSAGISDGLPTPARCRRGVGAVRRCTPLSTVSARPTTRTPPGRHLIRTHLPSITPLSRRKSLPRFEQRCARRDRGAAPLLPFTSSTGENTLARSLAGIRRHMMSWSTTFGSRRAPISWCVALALVCNLLGPAVAHAARGDAAEYQVKGAFLVHFMKLTEWPASPQADAGKIVVCVLGSSPISSVLHSFGTTTIIRGRQLLVKRLLRVADAGQCEALFISQQASSDLDTVVRSVPAGVLTISEITTQDQVPTVINFVVSPTDVDFDVSLEAATRARLEISSRLLSVARAVDGKRRKE
jgi:hypothetical protein